MSGQIITTMTSIGHGTCNNHKVPQTITLVPILGDSRSVVGGTFVVSVGDLCKASCGHFGVVVTGNPQDLISGRMKAETGSVVVGEGGQLEGVLTVGEVRYSIR
jgi:hypothetical protein